MRPWNTQTNYFDRPSWNEIIVREYVFTFFKNPKNATFYVFLEAAFQKKRKKNVIHNSKFQTLLTFHCMEFPLQLKNNVRL